MADGPYRHIEVDESPRPSGIVFLGNDEGLSVEVRRLLPGMTAGGTVMAVTAAIVLTRDWSNILWELVLVGNAGYWLWFRLRKVSRLTSIEIRGGLAKFVQIGVVRRTETTVPLNMLGLPTIGEMVIERTRLPSVRQRCLQFEHYVDGVRGGQSLPLQILGGYRLESLEWLRENIGLWMRRFGGIADP